MAADLSFLLLLVASFLCASQIEAQGRGSVRLFNNGSIDSREGTVQVYFNNQWGTICSTGSVNNDIATVVCHQLGYSGGKPSSSDDYGLDNNDTVISNVSCNTNYLVILQCSHNDNPPASCADEDPVSVICDSTPIWNNPYSGMLRLQNGSYAGEGRVEVYCNGQWGSLCQDNEFNSDTANTVCTQLGYTTGSINNAISYDGIVWLDRIGCNDNQSCLNDCATCPATNVTCTEGVANVTCSYNGDSAGLGSSQYTCSPGSSLSVGALVGIIIGSIVACFCCLLIIIGMPLCICCCLGVGIGAVARREKYKSID